MRSYCCLSKFEFIHNRYKLVPIRDEDKYVIMQWRNEQINNLRQKTPLHKEQQELYFNTVINDLFNQEKPNQLLFSFLENNKFIGYGGLVHIDWESKNAEISFLIETRFALDEIIWAEKFSNFFEILIKISKNDLNFNKLYTYCYEVEPYNFKFKILQSLNLTEEARLKKHILIDDVFQDVLIHSYFL